MTFWMDLTTTRRRQPVPVGVVRVEVECAKQFLESELVKFCYFDRYSKSYRELDKQDARELLAWDGTKHSLTNSGKALTELEASNKKNDLTPSLLSKMKLSVKPLIMAAIYRLPSRTRTPITKFLRIRQPGLLQLARSFSILLSATKLLLQGESGFEATTHDYDHALIEHPFTDGDTLISMGADWNDKCLLQIDKIKRAVNLRVILFCYDVIPALFPHLSSSDLTSRFTKYLCDVAWVADTVICTSDNTRNDFGKLIRDLGAPEPGLAVVRLGDQKFKKASGPLSEAMKSKLRERDFILCVSTIERRKNHEILYRAYVKLLESGTKKLPLMIIVGTNGWGGSDFRRDLELDSRIQGYFLVLNHVTDEDLANLYANALFTVYPSLYEGWGLPIAEALACGKFCLASNSSSLSEIGRDLITYIDPWDVSAWADHLRWFIANPDAIAEREKRISAEYEPTSWSETVGQILNIAAATNYISGSNF